MNKIAVIILALFSISVYAQGSNEKTVGEFTELKVYDLIQVELIKSKKNKVVISGENKDDVLINNKNGTLKIKMKFEEAFDGKKTKVKLYYTSLDVIDANEGATIYSNDTIKQFELDLNAQEGATINVKVNVNYLNIRSVTGGDIFAFGKTEHQDVSIYTGGDYDGKELKSKYTEVSIRAAGVAHVNASKKVSAKVRAGGDIFIYGNPEDIKENKVLGGRIKIVEN